jgi:hypothetical protein
VGDSFQCQWDTTTVNPAVHYLRVKATDTHSNTAEYTIAVSVKGGN